MKLEKRIIELAYNNGVRKSRTDFIIESIEKNLEK